MLFSKPTQDLISKIFYDKDIYVLSKTNKLDDEGGLVKEEDSDDSIEQSFKGNVNYTQLGTLQAELGLVEKIDISISCSTSVEVKLDDLIKVNGVIYLSLIHI
mgnify:CR=1 FL=1